MTSPVKDRIRALADGKDFDVFFNVCEGYEFEDMQDDVLGYDAIEVVRALEELELPFTGAHSNCFDPTREEMRLLPMQMGLGLQEAIKLKNVLEAQELVLNISYPIMIKHPKSYGSTGMTKDSRADTLEEVKDSGG